ncbi:MAG TPA: hypothetical protein VF615_02120 [Longimicrobiaceae bacterium]|jgi:hypothetical protein
MALILTTVAIAALAAPVFALHYLTRLPEAPACPTCRRITTRHEHGAGADRLLAVLSTTQVRRCTVCGWQGRMRWRWAMLREGSGR